MASRPRPRPRLGRAVSPGSHRLIRRFVRYRAEDEGVEPPRPFGQSRFERGAAASRLDPPLSSGGAAGNTPAPQWPLARLMAYRRFHHLPVVATTPSRLGRPILTVRAVPRVSLREGIASPSAALLRYESRPSLRDGTTARFASASSIRALSPSTGWRLSLGISAGLEPATPCLRSKCSAT